MKLRPGQIIVCLHGRRVWKERRHTADLLRRIQFQDRLTRNTILTGLEDFSTILANPGKFLQDVAIIFAGREHWLGGVLSRSEQKCFRLKLASLKARQRLSFAVVGVGQVVIVAVIPHHVHPVVGTIEVHSRAALRDCCF